MKIILTTSHFCSITYYVRNDQQSFLKKQMIFYHYSTDRMEGEKYESDRKVYCKTKDIHRDYGAAFADSVCHGVHCHKGQL